MYSLCCCRFVLDLKKEFTEYINYPAVLLVGSATRLALSFNPWAGSSIQ